MQKNQPATAWVFVLGVVVCCYSFPAGWSNAHSILYADGFTSIFFFIANV